METDIYNVDIFRIWLICKPFPDLLVVAPAIRSNAVILNLLLSVNPYKSSVLFVGHGQTLQTQIRRHIIVFGPGFVI